MPPRRPIVEVSWCHALLVAGALCARAAYGSGDPSGLQYLLLVVGAGFAGVALGLLLLVQLLVGRVPTPTWGLAVATLVVALYPWLLGWGFDGRRLDPVGYWSATLLVAVQLVVTGWLVRWYRAAA